ELAELVSLHGPLLTIVGPSGSGKSRLALELARRAHERGIFVDLSQARESSVIAHVARALHVDALSPSQLVAALRDRVEHEPLLIVLDACDACGEGVAEFIKAVHGIEALRTIVTARGALGLRGEQIYELGPLA
ncbi:MAG TPA: ATP-binding protein, partial [Verrucomicrobiae bacterium]|nr:ATP-binding protein [Verrucomicrobiae bacterium]